MEERESMGEESEEIAVGQSTVLTIVSIALKEVKRWGKNAR